MQVITTDFPGLLIIEPVVHRDERGFFLETFREDFFAKHDIDFKCVQTNQSFSVQKGVLRGIHFQAPPMAQAKLVWVTAGEVMDVVVDLRKDSPTFGQHYCVNLSAENFRRLFVPKGFAHAYFTLTPNTEFNYIVDAYYAPQYEGGICWNDAELGIKWPLDALATERSSREAGLSLPIISDKDAQLPCLRDLKNPF